MISGEETKCTIYLARHGQTDWNAQGIIQGSTDIHLNVNGLTQAQNLASQLDPIQFDAIYASGLTRAQETAQTLAQLRHLEVVIDDRLNERYFGGVEGHAKYEPNQSGPKTNIAPHTSNTPPESNTQLITRVMTSLLEISRHHLGENVLIISHSGVIFALLLHFHYASPQALKFPQSISNSAYIVITSDGLSFTVEKTKGITVF